MYKTHVSLLKDPQTKKPFKLLSFKNNASEIIDGLLISNNNWYPIISGVPRVLLGSLRHDYLINHAGFYKKYLKKFPKQCTNEWRDLLKSQISVSAESHHQLITGSSFAYEWKSIYRENNYEQQNYLHFLSPYVKAKDLKGKKILDLGCGSGRFTKQASLLGANISVGVDVGESVDTAYKMCRFLDNVLIVQADIYNLPFENSFDIATRAFEKKMNMAVIKLHNSTPLPKYLHHARPLRIIFKAGPEDMEFLTVCSLSIYPEQPLGDQHLLNIGY